MHQIHKVYLSLHHHSCLLNLNPYQNIKQLIKQKKHQAIINHKRKYTFLSEEEKQNIQEIINRAKNIITNELLPIIKKFISHKQLVQILEKGTPEEFRNGMRNHLENHFNRLFDLNS